MQVLLDARHLLFSLASPASTLVPAQSVEAVRRARDKLLQERAADISLDFWRAARPAADVGNNDDKLNAAKMRAVVRHLTLPRHKNQNYQCSPSEELLMDQTVASPEERVSVWGHPSVCSGHCFTRLCATC